MQPDDQGRASVEPTALAVAPRLRGYPIRGPEQLPRFDSARPRNRPRRSARAHRAGLVLIVDDSRTTREMYAEYLNHRGFWTVTAPDGEASLPLAFNLKPDVIVMDLAMPRLDGVTAIRRLRQHPRTRQVPVIMLTGYPLKAIEDGALEAGATVFLTKPCLPEELERHVNELRGRKEA
ncbi:MAG TPA: response regulator [Methylomirabilota bacterium]|nr:response regulator [Methylomirabilota bacterium]